MFTCIRIGKNTRNLLGLFTVHFGGGLVGVLTVPFFSYDYGILYNWDQKSAYVSRSTRVVIV